MFPPTDNPAARLAALLKLARAQDNNPVRDIWAKVFGIEKMDPATFYRVMGHLNSLADAVEVRIRQEQGINHELFLRDLPVIRKIICPENLNASWHTTKQPLDQGVLTGLEFCSEQLSRKHHEDQIPVDQLNEIQSEFIKLVQQVTESSLSSELKLVLLDLLSSAIISIENYKITGNDGIKRSIAYIIGLLTLHKELLKDAKEGNIMQQASKLLSRMVEAVSVAYKVKELSASIAKLIPASWTQP